MDATNNSVSTDRQFRQFQEMIFSIAGINVSPEEAQLIGGCLAKRIRHHDVPRYGDQMR